MIRCNTLRHKSPSSINSDAVELTVISERSLAYNTSVSFNADVYRPHSIILASCKPGCKPGFRPGLQPGFRQVRAGLRHAFDTLLTLFVENLVANLLHQSRRAVVTRFLSKFAAGFRLAFDMLSTCLRRAFDTLTQVESRVCSQVCSLLE